MLKTNYTDDVLDTSKNLNRVYTFKDENGAILNEGVTIEDTTVYEQTGSTFGAKDINETNTEVNKLTDDLGGVGFVEVDDKTLQWRNSKGELVNFSKGGDLLWTNEATSSPFTEQVIPIDLSEYDGVKIHYKLTFNTLDEQYEVYETYKDVPDSSVYTFTRTYQGSTTTWKATAYSKAICIPMLSQINNTSGYGRRDIAFTEEGLSIGPMRNSINLTTTWDEARKAIIPLRIYGIKREQLD